MIKLGLIRPDESQASLLDDARDDDRQHGLKGELPPDTRATTSMKACAAGFADVGNVSSFDAITSASRFARLLLVPRARDDDDSLDEFATRRVSRERRVIRVRGRSQLPDRGSWLFALYALSGPNLIIFHSAAPQGPAARAARATYTRADT